MIKRIYIIILIVVICLACQEDFKPGKTAAAKFAGEWFYEVQNENGQVIREYDYESRVLRTYNSASNKANHFWIDDQGDSFPVKALVEVKGEKASFVTTGYAVNEALVDPDSVPDKANVSFSKASNRGLVEIQEGKILYGAARVWKDKEQAPADSIYLKLVFTRCTLNYTSRENVKYDALGKPVDTTFIFEPDDDFYEVDNQVYTFIISGHRQTGWEVYF